MGAIKDIYELLKDWIKAREERKAKEKRIVEPTEAEIEKYGKPRYSVPKQIVLLVIWVAATATAGYRIATEKTALAYPAVPAWLFGLIFFVLSVVFGVGLFRLAAKRQSRDYLDKVLRPPGGEIRRKRGKRKRNRKRK